MATILNNITHDNTTYTVFENDQVLTSDQLNDLFAYLDVQSRLTRTRMLGVGIVGGLETDVSIGTITVSRGVAVTTDGDLIYFDSDQVFDRFVEFKDENAKYPFFRNDGEVIQMFQLIPSTEKNQRATNITQFEATVNDAMNNFVAVLYVEDYDNDPDLCTGDDCDNKGRERVRDTKVLLISKNNISQLLQSIPKINQDYFSLDLMDTPRVKINPATNLNSELRRAFSDTFSAKEDLKNHLAKAYQTCKLIVDEELNGSDPVEGWNKLIDTHFSNIPLNGYQYLYDFIRDLIDAYNELVDCMFGNNVILCPDVNLFPKHILLGAVSNTTQTSLRTELIDQPTRFLGSINFLSRFPFWRRFHPVNIDSQFRHLFYESPVLNSKNEIADRTKFLFLRINSMINNFSIPVERQIKITPGKFYSAKLGERAIPFYYRYDDSTPINFHWNYDLHIRRKEDRVQYYFASQYPSPAASVLRPLDFDISPYDFFRIEGHIGMNFESAEKILNEFIERNNLPIRVISVQIENDPTLIRPRPWFFDHLHVLDHVMRNDLMDHLHEINSVHSQLLPLNFKADDDEDRTTPVREAVTGFTTHYSNLIGHLSQPAHLMNLTAFHADLQNAVSASTTVKTNLRSFSMSQTSPAHDFLINTNIHRSISHISDVIGQLITQKKEELLFANFLDNNSGMEHYGGAVRGGTFVLVYSTEANNNGNVIADFMLPYSYVDKDIHKKPIVLQPFPVPPRKFDTSRLFELNPYFKNVIANKIKLVDDKINFNDTKYTLTNGLFDNIIKGSSIFNLDKIKSGLIDNGGLVFAGQDVTSGIGLMNGLTEKITTMRAQGTPEEDPKLLLLKDMLADETKNTATKIGTSTTPFETNSKANAELILAFNNATATVPEVKTQLSEHVAANVITNANANTGFINFLGNSGFIKR